MSGSRYWNQSRPKYVNGEPFDHFLAKKKIAAILEYRKYQVWLEANIARGRDIYHKGEWISYWPVDVYGVNEYLDDRIIVQIDGGYHQSSKIQKGRTKNRDDTLKEYCLEHGMRYIVLDNVDDVLYEYTNLELIRMLGLQR